MARTPLRGREEEGLTVGSAAGVHGARGAGDIGVEPNLAIQYAPTASRPDLLAVWQLDARMGHLYSGAREPALAEIKLAWWEERLRDLRTDVVPPEPLLRQLAAASMIDVADLVGIADGWRTLLVNGFLADVLSKHAEARGRGLMQAGAAALNGAPIEPMLTASEGYALVDLAAARVDHEERQAVLATARDRFVRAGPIVWPRALRPIGMIVELARGDACRGVLGGTGSPARVARMAWHALTGR